jgi:hypothetical protein
MDWVYLAAAGALWGATVALVAGCQRLLSTGGTP